jgi:multicomponent Na+:H+ antiporter subunit G
MMSIIIDCIAAVFVLLGLFFFAVAGVGVLRMPDTYHRLHAVSKASTLGLIGLLLGVVIHLGTGGVGLQAITVLIFAFVAGPVGSHMLAKAALRAHHHQWKGTLSDEHADDGLS